ncbi:MAG: tRNA lysidine(34) synthetase TilS [Clostridia bacterium]|nr:tRNA lysidine(34) synthetase TilS [Clostridia bacterium]
MVQIDLKTLESFFSSTGSKIFDVAESTIGEYSMASYIESGVLIGLSGGADSVMLLCLLLEYRRRRALDFTISCVHVNHGIRGEEADRDAAFCRELCNALDVELIVKGYDVPTLARGSGLSIEEAARITRYSVFNDIIRGRNDICCVSTAHNMSDSVETVIFNMLRGSGARGVSGIQPVRDNIIRPLIKVSKKDITDSLDAFGIPYVIDSTNLSDEYTRNYIRHEIVPAFSRLTNEPERMISRFADNMRSDDDFIRSVASDFISDNEVITNSALAALHYSVYIRVLAMIADKAGASISNKIASDIRRMLNKNNFSYSLIGRAFFVCERGVCRISRDTTEGADFCFEVKQGITELSPLNAFFALSDKNCEKTYSNVYKISIQANLSSAIISGSLYLRPKKDGDTVYYGGMTHKLKKLFSDCNIPRSKRKLIPILCDDKGVVWVPGFGVRDDGVAKGCGNNLIASLGIKTDTEEIRLYSASEFRT